MRSSGGVVVDEPQSGIDRLRDRRRRVVSVLLSGGPDAGVVQCFGPRVLIVGKSLLLPRQLGLLKDYVDAVMGRLQRLPFNSAATAEFPIPGNVFELDSVDSDGVMV